MALDVIAARISRELESAACYTATPEAGCTRLPFTGEARAVVDYLKRLMEEAGLTVWEDGAGNVFGKLSGSCPELPCIMMGSHYDSVIHGGNYDGIAGIICAVEAARLLQVQSAERKQDFVVAGFCDEEGMRFGTGYFGSGAILGERDVSYCSRYRDASGITIYEAMKAYGLNPERIADAAWPKGSIGKFLEIHIEQGPVLDFEKTQLGLVDCIVGIKRYLVSVHGRADHAGTTPMSMRIDAVEAAAKVIAQISEWAREEQDGTVATVGTIHTKPGGINIIAESCEFSVDIRSTQKEHLQSIEVHLKGALEKEVSEIGGTYEIRETLNIDPVFLSEEILEGLEESCKNCGYSFRHLASGAGHDALKLGQVLPAAMLFVPSRGGRSHCPEEYTETEDLARAVMVILDYICRIEKKLYENGAER